jgi:hypothetical protein
MMTKTTIASLFALSLLTLSGVGYATFTSSITVTGAASAGSLVLGFANPATSGTTANGGSCSFSGTGASTSLTISNLAPGDICTATITVSNSGSLPSSSETTALSGLTNVCTSVTYNCFYVYDNLGLQSWTNTNGAGGPIGAGGSFVYVVNVQLAPGSTQQSESGSFTITLTGSVGS